MTVNATLKSCLCLLAAVVVALPTVAQGPDSVRGTVVDPQQAAIAGATATLRCGEDYQQTATTGPTGKFTLQTGECHGTVTVTAPGFDTVTLNATTHLSQTTDLGTITLKVAANIQVTAVTTYELAEQQMKLEETQRLLGILPNFYISYIPNAAPMTQVQKLRLATRTVLDPAVFASAALNAGINQATTTPVEWGTDAAGYGQRYGAAYAGAFSGIMLSGFVYPAVFHQNPRYYLGSGTKSQRFRWAIKQTFEQKGDNGHWQPAYSNLLADVSASLVQTSIYPHQNTNWGATIGENFGLSIGGEALGNLLEEFLFSKLTTRKKP